MTATDNGTPFRTLNIPEYTICLHLMVPSTRHMDFDYRNSRHYVVGKTIWRHEIMEMRRTYRALRRGGYYDFQARRAILQLLGMDGESVMVTP